jgi:hypothetical protein
VALLPEDAPARFSPDALRAAQIETLPKMLFVAEAAVKKRTPVKTGHLRRSITHRVERPGERGVVGTNVIYARPVNARRHFMEQGLQDAEAPINDLLAEIGAAWAAKVTG